MIQIDFQKAFDRVHHDVLWTVLKRENIGNLLSKRVPMSYTECATQC